MSHALDLEQKKTYLCKKSPVATLNIPFVSKWVCFYEQAQIAQPIG